MRGAEAAARCKSADELRSNAEGWPYILRQRRHTCVGKAPRWNGGRADLIFYHILLINFAIFFVFVSFVLFVSICLGLVSLSLLALSLFVSLYLCLVSDWICLFLSLSSYVFAPVCLCLVYVCVCLVFTILNICLSWIIVFLVNLSFAFYFCLCQSSEEGRFALHAFLTYFVSQTLSSSLYSSLSFSLSLFVLVLSLCPSWRCLCSYLSLSLPLSISLLPFIFVFVKPTRRGGSYCMHLWHISCLKLHFVFPPRTETDILWERLLFARSYHRSWDEFTPHPATRPA